MEKAPAKFQKLFAETEKCLRTGKLAFGTLRQTNDLRQSIRVAKVNRCNEVTYGEVSVRRARLNIDGFKRLAYVVPHDSFTAAQLASRRPPFGQEGDSGSWVLNPNGLAVGLYSALCSDGQDRGFIMDTGEVNAHIEATINKKVLIADVAMEC